MTFYNLRTNPPGDLPYQVIKFDSDLNPESVYNVGKTVCECPAGSRLTCRHRQMLPKLIEKVDTAWFLCFETMEWEDPTGNAAEHDEVAEHDAATGGLSASEVEAIEKPLEEGTEGGSITGRFTSDTPNFEEVAPQAVGQLSIDKAVSQLSKPQAAPKVGWRRF